ncbi:MAG: hypothetical protein KDI71_07925 [Xanthomonadales bacterium]|nr:hypothetical protein [Xanthomonadales bacterium]
MRFSENRPIESSRAKHWAERAKARSSPGHRFNGPWASSPYALERRTELITQDLSGDTSICVDFESGAVFTADIEDGSIHFVAHHFQQLIRAIHALITANALFYDPSSGMISADQLQWERIALAHGFTSPW